MATIDYKICPSCMVQGFRRNAWKTHDGILKESWTCDHCGFGLVDWPGGLPFDAALNSEQVRKFGVKSTIYGIPGEVVFKSPTTPEIEQFKQLLTKSAIPDGDLISKAHRDKLHTFGLVGRAQGFNFVTERGVSIAIALGLLKK